MQGTIPSIHAEKENHARTAWVNNISTQTKLTAEGSFRMTNDIDQWRKYAGGIGMASSRIKVSRQREQNIRSLTLTSEYCAQYQLSAAQLTRIDARVLYYAEQAKFGPKRLTRYSLQLLDLPLLAATDSPSAQHKYSTSICSKSTLFKHNLNFVLNSPYQADNTTKR